MSLDAIEEYAEHVGDVVRWPGLVSTSLSRRVAARFGNVLFVIHAAACACIADAAAHRHEREVLFRPRSAFVILRVTRLAGRRSSCGTCTLTQIWLVHSRRRRRVILR
jgi:hypothetical protein